MKQFASLTLQGILTNLLLTQIPDEEVFYYHNDHLGTPQLMTNTAGTVVWKADYQPFGEANVNEDPDQDQVLVTNNLRFSGQYFGAETGYHYNWHRDYQPGVGRYVESDPVGGLLKDIGIYMYAGMNPLNFKDPYGLLTTGGEDRTLNTVVCDGRGGIKVQIGRGHKCVDACISRHEEYHMRIDLMIDPNVCKGKSEGALILATADERNPQEVVASEITIDCLLGKLRNTSRCDECFSIIIAYIKRMEDYRNEFINRL